jgi:cold shock CspA family protein
MALTGTVTAFDETSGLGTVTADGGTEYPFHCVSIADGSRSITPGTRVGFETGFRVARTEATLIVRL